MCGESGGAGAKHGKLEEEFGHRGKEEQKRNVRTAVMGDPDSETTRKEQKPQEAVYLVTGKN